MYPNMQITFARNKAKWKIALKQYRKYRMSNDSQAEIPHTKVIYTRILFPSEAVPKIVQRLFMNLVLEEQKKIYYKLKNIVQKNSCEH